jgi:HK97 family phage prohead protease
MSALARQPELAMAFHEDGRACQRPKHVRAIVKRMHGWRKKPEGCRECQSQAVHVRAGDVPLCVRCASQHRGFDVAPITGRLAEQRGLEPGQGLVGHALVFIAKSVDLGGFREIIKPEAVNRILADGSDLRALWNHNSALPLGRISAGTLAIRKDARGLVAEIDPNAQEWQLMAIRRGDVTGMSFQFSAIEDDWRMDGDSVTRDVFDMTVSEVSPVTFPAYPQTDIGVVGIGKRVAWLEMVHKTRMAR